MLNINLALSENENMNFKFVEQLMPPKMVLLKKMCTPSKMVLLTLMALHTNTPSQAVNY